MFLDSLVNLHLNVLGIETEAKEFTFQLLSSRNIRTYVRQCEKSGCVGQRCFSCIFPP
ncbi:hypothetical protein Peur_011336 [Populus x canadensis]